MTNQIERLTDADTIIQMGANLLPKVEGEGKNWQKKALNLWRAMVVAVCYRRDKEGVDVDVGVLIDYLSLPNIEKLYLRGYEEVLENGGDPQSTKDWSCGYVGIKAYLDSLCPTYNVEKLLAKHGLGTTGSPTGRFGKPQEGKAFQQDIIAYEHHAYRTSQLLPILNLLDKPERRVMTPVDRLAAIQKREIAAAAAAGEAFFLDLPDAWYEPHPTYGCENGHVSHRYLKSEQRGIVCLACRKPIAMLPGHYTDESLTAALAKESELEAHPGLQQSSDGVVAQGSPVGYEPSRSDYVKVARTFALAYGLHQDAPEYLPRTREAADDFEPHGWVIAALMQTYADGKWQGSSSATGLADGQAANCTLAKDTEATENVQKLKKALLILESIISPSIDGEDERGLERAMLRLTRRAVDECADLISRSIAGLQVTPNEWERMLSKLRGVQGATQSAVDKKRGGVNG